MNVISRIHHYALQLKGLLVFRKRVHIYGNFTVGNLHNVVIGDGCAVNLGVYILGRTGISIGNNVVLSARCMLLDAGLDLSRYAEREDQPHIEGPIRIEDGVWIGAGAIILPGVTIGRKSVVGAGSVVTRDVPPFTVVAGNPARRIGTTKASSCLGEQNVGERVQLEGMH